MTPKELDTRFIEPRLVAPTLQNEGIERFAVKQLSCRCYDKAAIYPGRSVNGSGGVISADGEYIHNTSVFNGCTQAGADKSAEVKYVDESVVYIGMLYGCWGHCLTDCLQRLWIFDNDEAKSLIRGKKLVYTTSDWRQGLPRNFYELLSVLGLEKDQLFEVTSPTRFREVVVPDSCFYTNLELNHIEYTQEYVKLIDRLRVKCDNTWRRVYLSRSKWGGGTFGEELLEQAFKCRGYEIIYPEKLTFDEQRRLLSETVELVATEGSVAHNSIFMPQGARVVIIRKAPYMNRWQPVINEMLRLEPIYIDANFTNFLFTRKYPTLGPFFLYVNSRMADYLGCKAKFPIGLYCRYVWYYLKIKGSSGLRKVGRLMKNTLKGVFKCVC